MDSENPEHQRLQIWRKRPVHIPKIAKQEFPFQYRCRHIDLPAVIDLKISPVAPRMPSQCTGNRNDYRSREPLCDSSVVSLCGLACVALNHATSLETILASLTLESEVNRAFPLVLFLL